MSHTHPNDSTVQTTLMSVPSLKGVLVNVHVPTTVEDYDRLAKKQGQCLADAIKNTIYRGVLAEFRDRFTDEVAKETGVERETEPTGKKTEAGEEITRYTQTEGEYFAAVLAKTGRSAESFQPLADSVASTIAFDPSATERKPAGPKKVAKTYIEAAQHLLDNGKGELAAQNLSKKLGREVLATLESLSAAISEDQRKKNLAAEYGA